MDVVNETGLEAAWTVGKINPQGFSLTAIVKGTFQLRPGESARLADEQLALTGDIFEADDPSEPLRYPSDFAPFKPRADALLVGTCYAPGGQPASAVRVGFQIGTRAKALVVSGDRHWTADGVPTTAAPFTALPLSWQRAYGGPGFDRNPLGRGYESPDRGAPVDRNRLPNIERADRLVRSRTDSAEPAGFSPIPDSWPQRVHKFGSFDDGYLEERWPWPPLNMDWGFFNAAPEDQQIEDFLRGDEELSLQNLHPSVPHYRSRLPGLRVRCFLNELARSRYVLREIPMHLDTSWIDMDTETLVLVWRGNVAIRSQKLIGPEHFFVATELLTHPLGDVAQFVRLLEEALARQEMEDDELESEEEPETEETEDEEPAQATASAPQQANGAEQKSEAEKAESFEDVEDVEDVEDAESVDAVPADEDALTLERVQGMALQRASFAGCDLTGLALAGLDLSGLDFREAILENVNLARTNLSQADLAGAILARANLREASCVGTIFRDADLTGAWLTAADLSGADLRGADLTRARLRFARMPDVNAAEAILVEADLSDADLQGANLTAADLCDARLHRTDFSRADLTDAAFENAWGQHVKAVGARMVKVRGAEALFPDADFRNSMADESVWESANLFAANFSGSALNGAEFSGAYVAHAQFDAAEMKGARLNEAILRGAHLRRCNLLEASFDQADLTGATFTESNLFGATLVDVVRDGTSFTGANLRRVKSRQEVT